MFGRRSSMIEIRSRRAGAGTQARIRCGASALEEEGRWVLCRPIMKPLTAREIAARPYVRAWLSAVALLIFAMVVVGGATRLTDSGLSITEWQPLLGAIPPLNDAAWQAAFEKYKAIPEYSIVNTGMSLAEFKGIYWWEWTHRLLGRLIGVAFALPFVGFWLAGKLRPGLAPKLLGVLALG